MANYQVSTVRYLLERMPVFRHVPREVHLRRIKYRRHYTKEAVQKFDLESEIAAMYRMRGAICFLCGDLDGIPLAEIVAAPYEDHLCSRCRAVLTRISERHTTLASRLRAISKIPMIAELTELCAEMEWETRYEHLRLRRMLIEDLNALRSGKLTPNEARARAALVRPIIDTMKLELLHEALDRPHPKAISLTEERSEATVIGIRRG